MSEGIEHLRGRLIELVGQYREAYQSRDLGQMMELFADEAEVVWAAGSGLLLSVCGDLKLET